MRYFRLYLYFLRFSFSKALQFRLDFFFRIVMDTIFYVTHILLFKIIYSHTTLLGGWNEPEALFFISCVFVIDAINMTIFANNAWWLPIYINQGNLDYYLTKPVSTMFFLSLREFAANSFLNLIIAGSFFIYCLQNLPGTIETIDLLSCGFFILVGCLLYHMINLLFLLPVFWTHANRGFGDLFFILTQFMEKPSRIYYGFSKVILSTILPFILVASHPASFVIEGFDSTKAVTIIVVTILMGFLVRWVWRQGLKAYSSASS